MTWYNEPSTAPELVLPGTRARQRFDQLRDNVRELVPAAPAVGASFAARFPMSGWQVWRRTCATWCEQVVDRCADRADAVGLASQAVAARVSP